MPPDRPASDPRALLSSAIQAVAESAGLDAALTGVLEAAVAGLGPVMGAIFLSDPDRTGLEMGASYGMDAAGVARLSAAVADPGPPPERGRNGPRRDV